MNVRDLFIPKALRTTAKGADVKSPTILKEDSNALSKLNYQYHSL